jgi:hypothetical protein
MKAIFNKQLIWPFMFLLFGLLFFAIGSGLTYRQRALEKQGIKAPGVVVALQENYDSDGSTYTPVVQFKTASGQNIEFSSSYSSSPPDYDVGEAVIVVYPSGQPENAIIKGDGQLLHVIFMLVGGLIVSIGSYLMHSTLRNLIILSPEG